MKGTVTTIVSLTCMVDSPQGVFECDMRRRLIDSDTGQSKPLTVGDEVEFDPTSAEEGMIRRVLPRRSRLSRSRVRGQRQDRRVEHVIVANVDQLLIVSSLREPPLTVGIIDRYIIAAGAGGLDPIVCINKIDLAEDPAEYLQVADLYRGLDFPVALTSATAGDGIEELRTMLAGQSTVLAGHSGVGKSSLLNALQPDLELQTGAVGEWKGRHCTSVVSLLKLDGGGYVVDTPGIREFSLWDIEREHVAQFFPQIWELSHDCRMPDCTHTHEPDCAVKAAVESGEIPGVRYESYLGIVESIDTDDVPRETDVDRPEEQISKGKRRASRSARKQRIREDWREELEQEEDPELTGLGGSVMATIVESCVICKQPGRYIGWPTIDCTPGDELVVVFSGDRDAHVCPFGKTFLMRSSDDGRTWSEPVVVNDTPLDDRDAGICALRDGTLVVSWFTAYCDLEVRGVGGPPERQERWRRKIETVTEEDLRRWARPRQEANDVPRGHWVRRSPDGGRTWGEAISVPPTAPHGPIELSDGRLMFVGNDGYERINRTSHVVAAQSLDKGLTWEVIARINMFPPYEGDAPDGVGYLGEPHVVEAEPGRLVVMIRHEEHPYVESDPRGTLWQCESVDGGHTWTEPRDTKILGKPPHLTKLSDGRLLVTYGYRHAPYGERACLSSDGGRTWDYENEVILRDDASNGDLGYPASVECAGGDVLTVYYQVDQPGEKTCLMATRWRPGR